MRHRLMCSAVGLVAAVVAASPAMAGECDNAASTVELNACSDKAFQRADRDLNSTYQELIRSIGTRDFGDPPYDAKSYERALRESQRAWVAFRDAECKGLVPIQWSGGTGSAAAVLGCMTEETKRRTESLRAHMEN